MMFCSFCTKWNMKGRNGSMVWTQVGCQTVRLDKITLHENSQMHQEAVKLKKDDVMSIHNIFHSYSEQETSSLVDAQKVLFFLIKYNLLHTTLFGPLIELCAELGAPNIAKLSHGKNATYTGHSTVQEFLECQAEVVEEQVLQKMRESNSFGLMLDEYTDVSTRKHIALVGRYLENGESKLAFLKDAEIPNGTADTIVKNVKDYLRETDLDQNKMTCFASDGPAVMTGKRNGVVAQLKRDNPALIDVHCVNHRLQLSVSSAFKSVTEIESVDEMLMGLFKYYHYSTVRSKSLEQMQTLIREMENTADDTCNVTIKKAVHTRWLSHEKAVHAVRRSYPAILADLENAVGMGNDKRAGDKQSVTAEGLYKQMMSYQNFYFILLLCDVCSLLSGLTKMFERRDLDLRIVEPQMRSSLASLKKMKEKPGPYLSRVDQLGEQYKLEKVGSRRTDVSRSKTLFLDKLMENLEQRLKVTPILTSLSALDLRKAGDSSFLTFHGDAEITELAEHFGLDVEKTQLEWSQVKELFAEEVDTSSPSTILKTLTSLKPQLGDLYPNIVKLLSIRATVILSTSEVERVFSHVKLIVTEHRNRLKIDNCSKLLMVSMNAKSSADIDLRKCVAKFLARKKRRL
ncbi:zinc finger protein 862-like [Haliotis asinina]|uniref:zinc finger protein 862-like n=1 Tax=Haliotis asinina TaxID=109174 RepID=UPI003532052D